MELNPAIERRSIRNSRRLGSSDVIFNDTGTWLDLSTSTPPRPSLEILVTAWLAMALNGRFSARKGIRGRLTIAPPFGVWPTHTVMACSGRPSTSFPRSVLQAVDGGSATAMTRRDPVSTPNGAVIVVRRLRPCLEAPARKSPGNARSDRQPVPHRPIAPRAPVKYSLR